MIKLKYLILISVFVSILGFSYGLAEELNAKGIPEPLIGLGDYYGHYIIVAEKSKHLLYLYKKELGKPILQKSFLMATGKIQGDKMSQGDFRTPEGIYYFNEFINKSRLLKQFGKKGEIYGDGAFSLNYPNPIDHLKGKNGNGIWLHSTNDETRIEKGLDSRGCIVISNNDLKELSQYIELHKTSIIIVDNLRFIDETKHNEKKQEIIQFINGWIDSWIKKDTQKYFQYYSIKNFSDRKNKNFNQFKAYKKAVFSGKYFPEISISDISFLQFNDYTVITFQQDYKSPKIISRGKKILYLVFDGDHKWKIVEEYWSTY